MERPPTLVPVADRQQSDVLRPNGGSELRPPATRTRVKWLRLAVVLLALALLAAISTLFGMLMAVASDLPALENAAEYRRAQNSVLYADAGGGRRGPAIARLTGNDHRILLSQEQISPHLKNAVVAIEDRRFYEHRGVDYQGILRALVQDVLNRRAVQGGSTITQQFVKNALSAQNRRTVLQKMREAALAYHLERKWSKQKILTEYLNTVYFGNGAYGAESAARTYFGRTLDPARYGTPGTPPNSSRGVLDGEPLAARLDPAQAALLAGMIASPSLYDPIQNPRRARARRNLVLRRMLEQGYLTRQQFNQALAEPLPTRADITPPSPDSADPYFSTWVTQTLVDRYGAGLVFGGGLRVTTTIDWPLQQAVRDAIGRHLNGVGPSAAVVAIENRTGEVKAIVGGDDYLRRPFNVAVQGHRQPGSAFKPFILIEALLHGISPDRTFVSRPKQFRVPGSPGEVFRVNNYENHYAGITTLRSATASSDNSVYAELGLTLGTRRIARLAQRMGIETPVSTNPAMTLGGLRIGLSPLELAYAYTTIANRGLRVSGTLATRPLGPVTIERVEGSGRDDRNRVRAQRVFPTTIGEQAQQVLAGVLQYGTGRAARIGEFAFGKTGTTENYGDAWFVGSNRELTVAVWVGYPDRLKPMLTEYGGKPVAGGTYPALIWRDVMLSWIQLRDQRRRQRGVQEQRSLAPPVPSPPTAQPGTGTAAEPPRRTTTAPAPLTPKPQAGAGSGTPGGLAPPQPSAPSNSGQAPNQAPRSTPPSTPPPSAPTPPSRGGGATPPSAGSGSG